MAKAEKMARVSFVYRDELIEVLIFPKPYRKFKEYVKPDNDVTILGRINVRDEIINVVAEEIFNY